MTLVVGYAPDGRGGAVLHLAGMLARSAHDDLVVCAVVPSPWHAGPAQVDSEYRKFLDGMARAALERARERLPGDVAAASWCTTRAPLPPACSRWPSAARRP